MEEDRSPMYFLGATTVIMFFAYFLPLSLRCVSFILSGFKALFCYVLSKITNKKGEDQNKKPTQASSACYRANIQETIDNIKASGLKAIRAARDRVTLYWQHPSLFFWNDLPIALNKILEPKNILLAMWLLSLYFFMIQVPQARSLEILELDPHDPTITQSDIKAAYKRLSFKYHPDGGRSEDRREKYEQVRRAFKRLKAAQKAQESGGVEEDFLDDESERGVSIPIPLFLQQYSSDHPARAVFFLLIIAFGLPAFVLYRVLFRPKGHKASARGTGIRSYADYQRYVQQIHACKDQIDGLFAGLGSIIEVPISGDSQKEPTIEEVQQEAATPKEEDPFKVIDDFALDAALSTTTAPELPPVDHVEETLVKADPDVKLVFEATTPSYLKTTFTYIDIVVNVVIEKIVPIDIQSKHKRLSQLYEDKKALIRKVNECVWRTNEPRLDVTAPIASKGDEVTAKKTESTSCGTLRFLQRTQNRYKIEKNVDSIYSDRDAKTDAADNETSDAQNQEAHCAEDSLATESKPFISTRQLEKLAKIDEEIVQLFADIEKSSFEYLSSHHTRGRKRQEKSKKIKKEKQAARS